MVPVGIGEVAGVAAPVGLDRWLDDLRATFAEAREDRIDLVVRARVVGQGDALESTPRRVPTSNVASSANATLSGASRLDERSILSSTTRNAGASGFSSARPPVEKRRSARTRCSPRVLIGADL